MIFRFLLFWLGLAIAFDTVAASLVNEQIQIVISEKDGAVIALGPAGGGAIFRRIDEVRRLETAESEIKWDEAQDEVVTMERPSPGVLRFECRNPAVADQIERIVKTYTLQPGEDSVIRETHIVPKEATAFLEVRTEAELDPAFRRNAFYTAPYPVCAAPLPASGVTEVRPLYSSVYLLLSAAVAEACNPARNLTAATWLVERNGRYCYWGFFIPDEKKVATEAIQTTPNGWSHLTNRDALKPGRENSWTVHYSLLKGDSSLLIRRMLECGSRLALTDDSGVPEWLTRVKLMMFIVQADHRFSPETVAIWKRLAELPGPSGYLMPMFDLWGHKGGDCPTDTDEVKQVIGVVELTKREIPQARIGTYTILLADQGSELMRQLPEIAVKDRSGEYPMADFPGRRMIQLRDPRAVAYFTESWNRLIDKTKCDFWYLDGGEGNAFDCMDYGVMEVSGFGEHYDFLRRLKELLREGNRERAVFVNSPAPLLADACFQEIGAGQWTNQEWWKDFSDSNWRTLSDALYYAKLATRYRPGTWCSFLYPYVPQRYFAMMLALALKPNSCPITEEEFAVYRDLWLPFVNAAFEIRDFRIADWKASPNWRREKTDWDIFVLESAGQLMVSAVNHGPAEAEIEARLEELPPEWTGRTLYARFHQMNPVEGVKKVEQAVFSGAPKTYRAAAPLPLYFRLPPETAGAWILTDFPVWIRRLGDYTTQYRQLKALDVAIVPLEAASEKGLRFSVNAPDEVELEILVPETGNVSVRVNGEMVKHSLEEEEAGRHVVLVCPQGIHEIGVEFDSTGQNKNK